MEVNLRQEIEDINFQGKVILDTENITKMSHILAWSNFNQKLKLDTKKVIDMSYMFYGSKFGKQLNIDISNVTNLTKDQNVYQ